MTVDDVAMAMSRAEGTRGPVDAVVVSDHLYERLSAQAVKVGPLPHLDPVQTGRTTLFGMRLRTGPEPGEVIVGEDEVR